MELHPTGAEIAVRGGPVNETTIQERRISGWAD